MTYTQNLAAINAKLDELRAGLEQAVNQTPRRVKVLDIANREQILEPDRIFHLAGYEQRGALPNEVYDATVCLFSAANDGKLVQAYLPGKPSDVASQLGINIEPVELTKPTPRIVVGSAAQANALIAAMGK